MLIQKIFIASPGDVCDERNLAKQVIDRIRGERLFRGKVALEVIAWNQPGVEVPMDVAMTPQKAIESGNNNYGIFNKINRIKMKIFLFSSFLPQSLPI